MTTRILRTFMLVALLAVGVVGEGIGQEDTPFTVFNVYSLGDIGSAAAPYHSDFQGLSGAAGSAWFNYMSLNDLGLVPSEYSIFLGGEITMTGDVNNGGIQAGGLMTLTNVSVDGPLSGGADLIANGITCAGDVQVAGTADITASTISGTVFEGVPFTPIWDHAEVSAFFIERSAFYGSHSATLPYTVNFGEIRFNAVEEGNVFEIDASVFPTAWGVRVSGSAGQTVIINVHGTDADISWLTWTLSGSIQRHNILLNFVDAQTLYITETIALCNILAPLAATDFPAGLVEGGLWVGDLQGGGQVNYGFFAEPDPSVPTSHISWGQLKETYR